MQACKLTSAHRRRGFRRGVHRQDHSQAHRHPAGRTLRWRLPLLASQNGEAYVVNLIRFWCAVALPTGEFHAQPLPTHQPLGLAPRHFARMLTLFEATAVECFSLLGAAHLIECARRIAHSAGDEADAAAAPAREAWPCGTTPTPPQSGPAQ